MDLLLSSLSIAQILVVWFLTDALETYLSKTYLRLNILGIQSYLKSTQEFENSRKDLINPKREWSNYREWVLWTYKGRIVGGILKCPICLATWLAICPAIFLGWQIWLPTAFLSSLFYFVFAYTLSIQNH